MPRVKEKRGNIYVCGERRKTTIRNLNFLLAVYEYTKQQICQRKGWT